MKRFLLAAASLVTLAPLALGAQRTTADDVALRLAMETETIRGDVTAAMAEYRRLATSADRVVAARALVRIARRQALAGDAGARGTYERVLAEFAGDARAVADARAGLAALDRGQAGGQTRLVWDDAIDTWGRVSDDGRYLSFVDWETGDLAIRDLRTGLNRRVTDKGGFVKAEAEAEGNAISPDGRLVAFAWDRWDRQADTEGNYELRVIDADGRNERVLLRGRDIKYLRPFSWSPDGTAIGVRVERASGSAELIVVSRDGSRTETLASYDRRNPQDARFSPDGRWVAFTLPRNANDDGLGLDVFIVARGSGRPPTPLVENGRLMEWTPNGRAILFSRTRGSSRILFVQPVTAGQASGPPDEVTAASEVGSPLGITRDGTLFFTRTRRVTNAVRMSLDPSTGAVGQPEELRPIADVGLAGKGGAPRFAPDGSRLVYTSSPRAITTRQIATGVEHTVVPRLNSILSVDWSSDAASLLVTGIDMAGAFGLFRVDPESGATSLLARIDEKGLVVVSPDGSRAFYQKADRALYVRDLRSDSERRLIDWDDGVMFSAAISNDGRTFAAIGVMKVALVDVASGKERVLFQSVEASPERFRLGGVFTKDDRALLLLVDVNDDQELWVCDLAGGGEPRKSRMPLKVRGLSLSADGRWMAASSWQNTRQVFALERFLPAGR